MAFPRFACPPGNPAGGKTEQLISFFVGGQRGDIRHGGQEGLQVGEGATLGALFDSITHLPRGDLGGEGHGDDVVHAGVLPAGDLGGLAEEKIGDGGLNGHGIQFYEGMALAARKSPVRAEGEVAEKEGGNSKTKDQRPKTEGGGREWE